MKHLIDKDKTIAEIERFKKEEGWCQVGKDTADVYYARGFRFACERILNALDTSEVKEIDLENSFDAIVCKLGSTYLKEIDKDAIIRALEPYKTGDDVKVIIVARKRRIRYESRR